MKNNNRGFETTYVVLFPLSHYDQYRVAGNGGGVYHWSPPS